TTAASRPIRVSPSSGESRPAAQMRPWQCLNFLPEPHGQVALRGVPAQGERGAAIRSSPLSRAPPGLPAAWPLLRRGRARADPAGIGASPLPAGAPASANAISCSYGAGSPNTISPYAGVGGGG